MAKGHALLGILQRGFERALRDARGLRSNADAPAVQRRERHLVALAFVADAIRNRHCAIREDKFAARRRADPQLFLFLADLETWRPFFNYETGNAC